MEKWAEDWEVGVSARKRKRTRMKQEEAQEKIQEKTVRQEKRNGESK